MTGDRGVVTLPPTFVETVAELVLERLHDKLPAQQPASPWLCGAKAAADYLGCGLDRVKRLTAAGVMPCRKQDGRCFYRRDEIDAWLDEHYEGPPRVLVVSNGPC